MATAETATTRAPRGAKPVSQAFLTALEAIPEATRDAVAKAAQTMIRDELKMRRQKVKENLAKAKAKAPAIVKPATQETDAKSKAIPAVKAAPAGKVAAKARIVPAVDAAPVKPRARKPAGVPAAT